MVDIGKFQAGLPKRYVSAKPSKYRYIDISHDGATFSLPGGQVSSKIYCDVLGISQSRTMWPTDAQREINGSRAPICQSPDGAHGYPSSHFPYEETLFNPEDAPHPCEECPLGKWSKAGAPPCKNQWVLIVQNVSVVSFDSTGIGTPDEIFLIKLSASGITRAKQYFEPLVKRQMMLYHWRNRIELKRVSRNGRGFAEPTFEREDDVREFDLASEIRLTDFLREARSFLEEPPVIGPKITGIQLPINPA